jgi:kynurenine 3-monooxygenase
MKKICIVGGGITGLAAAIELSRKDYQITVIEKYNFKPKANKTFLSFNFTVNYRGKTTLQKMGLWQEVERYAVPLSSRKIHSSDGTVKEQKYCIDGSGVLYSIPRAELLSILYKKALCIKNISLLEESEVSDVEICDDGAVVHFFNANNIKQVKVDLVIGADGAHSIIRQKFKHLFFPENKIFPWSYIDFKLHNSDSELITKHDNNSIHIWSGNNFLCVGIPNRDGSISLLYLSEVASHEKARVINNFLKIAQQDIEGAIGCITSLQDLKNCKHIGSLVGIKCKNWFAHNKVLILGDAAHAVFPFYGQGMNNALQDVHCLMELLDKYELQDACKKLFQIRKPAMSVMFQLSEKHFDFLKKHSHSILYNASYKLDLDLNYRFPKFWYHEYTTFSNTNIDAVFAYKRLKLQRWLKFTPMYALMYLYYLMKEILKINKDKNDK